MLASEIPAHEDRFMTGKKDSSGKLFTLKPFSLPIPNTNETMDAYFCRPASGDKSYFYNEKVPKDKIVLHFTAGFLKGDLGMLTRPNMHVSTAFVLARNGAILNIFQSARWSYHLGKGALGGNKRGSASSIGIEISNIGPLTRKGDRLMFGGGGKFYPYCTIDQTEYFTELPTEWRGYKYYASFTETQYLNLIKLLKFLIGRYNIPPNFLPEPDRYETTDRVGNYKGILSHINYRTSGKWDIGPAFDWDRVIKAVNGVVLS